MQILRPATVYSLLLEVVASHYVVESTLLALTDRVVRQVCGARQC